MILDLIPQARQYGQWETWPRSLVTSRGDRREGMYGGDVDRRMFLDLFAQVRDQFNWRAHAYCLMTSRYHLLVETPDADGNLSEGMRLLNGVYTRRTIRRAQMQKARPQVWGLGSGVWGLGWL